MSSCGNTVVSSKLVMMVTGGNLGMKECTKVWKPREMTIIEGNPYIPLGERDHMLKAYLGIQMHRGYFQNLIKMRNDAVDALLLKRLRELDEFATALPSNRKLLNNVSLPTSIILEIGEAHSIEVLTERNMLKTVYIHLTAPNLHALSLHARDYAVQPPQRKRKRADVVELKYEFIKRNPRRLTLSVGFTTAEGVQTRKLQKVDEWTQEACDEAQDVLVDYLRAHHHAVSDGVCVLASAHGLDMFAAAAIGSEESDAEPCDDADDDAENAGDDAELCDDAIDDAENGGDDADGAAASAAS